MALGCCSSGSFFTTLGCGARGSNRSFSGRSLMRTFHSFWAGCGCRCILSIWRCDRLVLEHLLDGCYQEACILRSDTVTQMHRMQVKTPFEGQNMTFDFVESILDGRQLPGHSGSIRGRDKIGAFIERTHPLGY